MSVVSQKPTWLSTGLRELASMYFDGKPLNTACGICKPLADLTGTTISGPQPAYYAMRVVMDELGFTDTFFGGYSYKREDWEPRAYMCLLLAEYLEAPL